MKTKKSKKGKKKKEKSEEVAKQCNLLVIDSDPHDWNETFKQDKTITIDQCEWSQIVVHAESNSSRPLLNIKANSRPKPGTGRDQSRVFQPDFIIVRKLVRGLHVSKEDYTNILYGLILSDVPAVNSLLSIQQGLERPVVYSQLNRIKKRLGADHFPLIPMDYYSHHTAMRFTPSFPLVAKVGFAEAGYGKMKFEDQGDLEDFAGVVALHEDYVTLEPLIQNREYDIRVQYIGKHLRAYKRINPNWKGNRGTAQLEEIQVKDEWRIWTEEVSQLFGGMDIFTVDAIHTKDGKDHILEINDTASGFAPTNQVEDMQHVREIVLQRLKEAQKL